MNIITVALPSVLQSVSLTGRYMIKFARVALPRRVRRHSTSSPRPLRHFGTKTGVDGERKTARSRRNYCPGREQYSSSPPRMSGSRYTIDFLRHESLTAESRDARDRSPLNYPIDRNDRSTMALRRFTERTADVISLFYPPAATDASACKHRFTRKLAAPTQVKRDKSLLLFLYFLIFFTDRRPSERIAATRSRRTSCRGRSGVICVLVILARREIFMSATGE